LCQAMDSRCVGWQPDRAAAAFGFEEFVSREARGAIEWMRLSARRFHRTKRPYGSMPPDLKEAKSLLDALDA